MAAGARATPFELTVELRDAAGVTVALPLSQFGTPPPLLAAQLVKAGWLLGPAGFNITIATPFERVPQTYDLPLAAFQQANASFQPGTLTSLRFTFSGSEGGDVYLDEVGYRRAP
jgi:hypothetical protein